MSNKKRVLIDIAMNGLNRLFVKYEYTEKFDSSIAGKQEEKVYIGKWEEIQTTFEANKNDKTYG